MLIAKTETKLSAIVKLYVNGNRVDTAKKIKALNRLELVQLMLNTHTLHNGVFLGAPNQCYDFERFIERALTGYLD